MSVEVVLAHYFAPFPLLRVARERVRSLWGPRGQDHTGSQGCRLQRGKLSSFKVGRHLRAAGACAGSAAGVARVRPGRSAMSGQLSAKISYRGRERLHVSIYTKLA